MINVEKVFVLHVKSGYEDRKIHMDKMLSTLNIEFDYILDGDISDLSDEILKEYFEGTLKIPNSTSSCAMKHIIAYDYMVKNNINNALILEDDIYLKKNFNRIFNQTIEEINNRDDINKGKLMISYENSRLRFVPRSTRVKNRLLYKENMQRMTGAYYLTLDTAELILSYLRLNKMSVPIDIFHGELIDKKIIDYYWVHPTIAEQGSHSGMFNSSISNNYSTLLTKVVWFLSKKYKEILYFFR